MHLIISESLIIKFSPKRMARQRKKLELSKSRTRNKARGSTTFLDGLRQINRKVQTKTNRHANLREFKHIRASLAEGRHYDEYELTWSSRLLRWLLALILLPICLVTTQTLWSQFSHETLQRGFWRTPEFWYFSLGAIIMLACLLSGLGRKSFLWLYVLGHEYTHAMFVVFHFGWVFEFKASRQGGYIATNKTNLLISLSPYFVPSWSMATLAVYGLIGFFTKLPPYADLILFFLIGSSWAFHIFWTLWMIPRDQPDLKENDTFFSLVIIYLANILLLCGMLCISAKSLTWHNFLASWWINAENFYRHSLEIIAPMLQN